MSIKRYHIKALLKANLLSIKSIFYILKSYLKYKNSLMTLFRFCQLTYPKKTAIVYQGEGITYQELFERAQRLAFLIQEEMQIKKGMKVVLICRNHPELIQLLGGLSISGVRLYLLNTEMSSQQLTSWIKQNRIELIIKDEDIQLESLVSHTPLDLIEKAIKRNKSEYKTRLKVKSGNELIILTGGTSGIPKTTKRKPSIVNFLMPFLELLHFAKLYQYQTLLLPIPIFHGYGLATLLMSFVLGKKMIIVPYKKQKTIPDLIIKNHVEVLVVVPTILQRIYDNQPEVLQNITCIISGGAKLQERLINQVMTQFGDILYNLYGTSEAGFSFLAIPEILKTHPSSIGIPLTGVKAKIDYTFPSTIGELHVRNAWSGSQKKHWIKTGDLATIHKEGVYFLKGRIDEMIVSGGENVYPCDVEHCILQHQLVKQVAVIGISDYEYGQILVAYVELYSASLTKQELKNWLGLQLAKYQIPKQVHILPKLPVTAIGKIDKKRLLI